VLNALAALGEQVLDLEDLAAHRGSVLGEMPGRLQPTQKAFETQLARRLAGFDLARTVWVEAESRRIGRLTIPEPLLQRMRASPVVEIRAAHDARIDYLLREYAWLGADGALLAEKLGTLRELLPRQLLSQWQDWAVDGKLAPLLSELLTLHYDPLYKRSQSRDLSALPDAAVVETDDLSAAGIDALARRVLAAAA